MLLEYAISAQKYPKIVTQKKEKIQGIRNSVFQNYVVLLRSFDVVFYMLRRINQTFHDDKNVAGIKLENEMWC